MVDPLEAEVDTSDLLAAQLDQARCELAALEQALVEMPQILEVKFKQRVSALNQINQQLLQEQLLLVSQLAAPSGGTGPRWRALSTGLVGCAGLVLIGWGGARWLATPQPSARLPHSGVMQQAPGSALSSSSTVVVRAQGPSWVEVQDLRSHEVLFIGVLETGDARTIRLRQGLRLRSGRPDLLSLQVDGGAARPLGADQGQGWHTLLPPGVRTAGA